MGEGVDQRSSKLGIHRNDYWKILCVFLIVFFILIFIQKGVLQSIGDYKEVPSNGRDLWNFRAGGYLWRKGENPYDPDKLDEYWANQDDSIKRITYKNIMYYYPPQTSVIFSWLSRLSYGTSYWLFLTANIILTIIVMFLVGIVLSWYLPIGLLEITLLSSFLHIGLRTNIRFNQSSTLVAVFVFLTFVLAKNHKEILAGIALGFVSLKPTFFPLFWIYYFVIGSRKLVISSIISGLLLTVLPIIFSGRNLFETMENLIFARQTHLNDFDNPSPFVSSSITHQNFEPLVFRISDNQSNLTLLFSWIIILSFCILIYYLIYKNRHIKKEPLLDFAIISVASILVVYHKNYDSFLLLLGLLYIYIQIQKSESLNTKTKWLMVLLVILGIKILPTNFLFLLFAKTPFTIETYIGRLLSSFHVWGNILLLVTLLLFKISQYKEGRLGG